MFSNYNMNISRDVYKPMLQWQPQHPIQGKDLETSSHIEYPLFKKRRICENFVPNHWTPGAMREVASSSLKAKQCGSQRRGFGDDSKRLCRLFCSGRNCSYGDRCRFLHVIPDKIRDISMISVMPSTALVNQIKGQMNWVARVLLVPWVLALRGILSGQCGKPSYVITGRWVEDAHMERHVALLMGQQVFKQS